MVDLSLLQSVSYIAGALGVCVAAIFYILNLRISQRNQELGLKNQQQTLETRQAQMFMNIYQQTTTNEFALSNQIYISSQWANYAEFSELYQKKEFYTAFLILAQYWEGLGVLVKEGFLPIRLVALLITGGTRMFWEKLKPIKDEVRVDLGYARWMSETEYLYDELLRYLEAHPELSTEYKRPPQPR